MYFVYKNVFIGKDASFNYCFNLFYWFFKILKDVFKWIYSVSLFAENKTVFALSFITPIMKFSFIGLQNLIAFKTNFRGHMHLIIFCVVLLIIESFFELPMHLMCPVNKIYLHTNYNRVYDKQVSSAININLEGIECLMLLGFLLWYFIFGKDHYSAIVLIVLVIPLVVFNIGAKVFYCCYEVAPEDDHGKEKDNTKTNYNNNDNSNQVKELRDMSNSINQGYEYRHVTINSEKNRAYPYY